MNKNEYDKNNTGPDKMDMMTSNTFILSLIIGMLIAGITLVGMAG